MYNMYDDDDIEMKEEQLIYYIDEKEEDAIQEEETELPEITEDYLKIQEKLSNDEKELILFKDSKNKVYEGLIHNMYFQNGSVHTSYPIQNICRH